MPYIAARWTHIPHQDGAREARERGHGLDIQFIADIVAEFNRLWAYLESSISTYDVRDLLRDLGLSEAELEKLEQVCDDDYGCLLDAAMRLTKRAIAEEAERHGYRVFWVGETPFIVVADTIVLGVDVSPHDPDVTQFHLIFVATDLPLPLLRRYLPKVLEILFGNDNDDIIYGSAEVVYDVSSGEIKIVNVNPER